MIALVLLAAASFLDPKGHLSPAAFDFVEPGVTRAEVERRLGKPWVSSETVIAKGEIDLFVDQLPPRRPNAKPRETETVRYYEYRPEDHPLEYARIVFRGDRVWYAQLPPQTTERTPKDLLGRYGPVFVENRFERSTGDLVRKYVIHRIPDRGLAFVEHGGAITHRVVFPPVTAR